MFNEFNDIVNYQPCSICGVVADDGGLKDGMFVCHDCLDEQD